MPGQHSRRRSRRRAPVARWALPLIVVVVAGAAVVGWRLSQSSSSPVRTSAATTTSSAPVTGAPGTAVSTTTAPSASTAPSSTAVVTTTTLDTTKSGSTVPSTLPSTSISPPVSAPGSYTYTLAAGTEITVAATKPCWIEAAHTAGGTTIADTVLAAGQTQTFSSPLWLRLGDPTYVKVTAEGTALKLPALSGDLIVVSG